MSGLAENTSLPDKSSESERNPKKWTTKELIMEMKKNPNLQNLPDVFERETMTDEDLEDLTFDKLMQKDFTWENCLQIQALMEDLGCRKKETLDYKIFHDPIHGSIEIHPACVAVINTPQFQRLRSLKQLGLCYFVYPGAAHNRFEHCLGVCHLAGMFVKSLRKNQSYLGIDDTDVLCVELAGLCHDLGHGPFSHLFDRKFIPAVNENKWKHEQASLEMFDHLIEENGLMTEGPLKDYLTPKDITFIRELIDPPEEAFKPEEQWLCKGRGKEKAYLYEIVANKRNSIDVDKWDYLARDSHHLGIANGFDCKRYMKFARVISVDGQLQICIRDKEVLSLYNMFSTRYILHKIAYQHNVTCAIDAMVLDALIKANDYILTAGKNGKLKISECTSDMVAYTSLTDNVLFKILDSENTADKVKEAQDIIRRILCRDLYKCVNTKSVNLELTEDAVEKEILKKSQGRISKEDFCVQILRLDYGMKEENPLEKLNSYTKHRPNEAGHPSTKEVSKILAPVQFNEFLVRVCSKTSSKDKDTKEKKNKEVNQVFMEWFEEKFPEINKK